MSIGDARHAVCRPAGVANADIAVKRLIVQLAGQIVQLAFGAAPLDMAID